MYIISREIPETSNNLVSRRQWLLDSQYLIIQYGTSLLRFSPS